jgi:plastocyanin
MKAAALALGLMLFVATVAPTADARRVRCVRDMSKSCRTLPARPFPGRVAMQMTGMNLVAPMPAPAPDPGPGAPATTSSPPPPAPAPAPARLGVIAREWSLTLSRTSVQAGPAAVELQNFGEDAHNLRIERTDEPDDVALEVALAESGERQKASGSLAAGSYKVFCTLPGHDAQGMHAKLTVTP